MLAISYAASDSALRDTEKNEYPSFNSNALLLLFRLSAFFLKLFTGTSSG